MTSFLRMNVMVVFLNMTEWGTIFARDLIRFLFLFSWRIKQNIRAVVSSETNIQILVRTE
jgi:hypothetical protein